MINFKVQYFIFALAIFLFACSNHKVSVDQDPLPSWNEGKSKNAIIDFVGKVTNEANDAFIPAAERIAVFDNDGTLWSEQPFYFQFYFILDRIRELAPQHPEWSDDPLLGAAVEGDLHTVVAAGVHGLLKLAMVTHTGMTEEEYYSVVSAWIKSARHPETGKLFTEMVYQPMLEILEYLRANGFTTYIVSGGGVDFIRAFAEEVYGIPPEQVIGSSIKKRFEFVEGNPAIIRLPEMEFINDKEGKPVGIDKYIGRRPIAAFGNSDGDLQMLQWTAAGTGHRLMVYIHHTDEQREWAYDRESHIGKLDKGLNKAQENNWVLVDMEKEWNRIYP